MPVDVIMPRLGLTMEEGIVVQWLAAEGDPVEKGQALLEIETDKVVIEVDAPASGILGKVLVTEGQQVPILTLLAHILQEGEEMPAAPGQPRATGTTPLPERQIEPIPSFDPIADPPGSVEFAQPFPTDAQGSPGRIFSSPRARKRAGEHGLDWRMVPGSGPLGRVVSEDILRAVAESARQLAPAPDPASTVETVTLLSAEPTANLSRKARGKSFAAPWKALP